MNIEAGVLTMRDVGVKGTGKGLMGLYAQKRERLIEPMAEMVREGLLSGNSYSSVKVMKLLRELRTPKGLSTMSAEHQTLLYNSFGATLNNVVAVCKADKRYDEAWRRLITTLDATTLELRAQLGRELRVAYGYSWNTSYFAEIFFSALTVVATWEEYSRKDSDYLQHAIISIDPEVRRRLSDLFFGEDYREPHLSPALPEGSELTIENFEAATTTDLMTLEGVSLNGSMLLTNGSISTAALKRVKSQTPLPPFSTDPGNQAPDRIEMLGLTYFTLLQRRKKKEPIDIKELSKFATETMAGLISGPIFGTFLPALQGFTKAWTDHSYASTIASATQEILKNAAEQWMSLDNFTMQLLCSDTFGRSNYLYLKLFNHQARDKAKLIRKTEKDIPAKIANSVRPIDWWKDVGLKFAIHWIKYLCALGMTEIAMESGVDTESDPLEGMRYVRLTPLGRYCLGIDTEYTPEAHEAAMDVDFDPRNGIITIDEKSPFQMFLTNTARRISPTRFSITAETLLKGCKTKGELEHRIKNLSVIIDPKKEPALQAIIDESMRHTDCAERDGGYTLIRLRVDLPGLREAILTNFELREMTILAGPTLALVKTHKLERFNAICAAYGYLME